MTEPRTRERSRSPRRHEARPSRHRSRSPRQRHHVPATALPLNAQEISKHDLPSYRNMFALYLDIQKQMDIDDLTETEVKGRWKSFVGKWNRGELAEGWYEPKTLEKSRISAARSDPNDQGPKDEDEDEYGPALPGTGLAEGHEGSRYNQAHGASIPSVQDLRARDEQTGEDAASARERYRDDIRHERAIDRKLQKERLEEIAPRAEAGTRERQLEKKREKADSNRSFAASKDAGDTDLRDADVMGEEDSIRELKRAKKETERKKNEREIRKEEILRARAAERETRLAGLKEKEDRTMAMLKEIAKQRFGGGES
ncbi:hypothetical protein EDD37DRAFT_48553 [Exophiala viscosa]|nr:hypothetical protein EDD37DRAFT_48553 [Exophiala viscosa]